MRRVAWLVAFLIIVAPTTTHAQLWSGIIDRSRAIDWTKVGIPGGIPNRTTICATLNPGATAAQISGAIAACPSGQVVFLNAGTYNLSAGIDFAGKNNVTLRGAGPDRTILVFTGSTDCSGLQADMCLRGSFNWSGGPAHLTMWTAGYAVGTTRITLGSTVGLSVGHILILDQADDSADTGQVFVCDQQAANPTSCVNSGGTGGTGGRVVGGVDYNQQQYVQVTAINGNQVTISPGLYMPNWRTSQTPGAWWTTAIINLSGVEDMTLDHTSSDSTSGISFANAYQSWVKNVKSVNSNRAHVEIQYTAKSIVRDSYFYGTKNAATQSYGIETYQVGDILIENNIFQHIDAPILVQPTSGSVFAYNFDIDNYFSLNTAWQTLGPVWSHGAGTSMNLTEGNDGIGFIEDVFHGTHNFATVFRNRFTGLDLGRTLQTIPMILQSYARYNNFIGNVLGTPGYHINYQNNAPSGAGLCDRSIYTLGWAFSNCTSDPVVLNDPLTISTLMRWGNYDTVTGAAQWNPSEVPSGLSQFANPVPATQDLPASFYLSAKPSWWGTPWRNPPWPAIGPDVTGGQDLTGHAHKIPARLCYENSAKNPDGTLVFNAKNCYTSTPPSVPGAPTGVTVQ